MMDPSLWADRHCPGTDGSLKSAMSDHPGFGWMLLILGLVITGIGLVVILAPSIPWLGRLPGDIRIERENFRFYFPLATCLLLSLVLSMLIWVIRLFRG